MTLKIGFQEIVVMRGGVTRTLLNQLFWPNTLKSNLGHDIVHGYGVRRILLNQFFLTKLKS